MNKKIIIFMMISSQVMANPLLIYGEDANSTDFVRFSEKQSLGTPFAVAELKNLHDAALQLNIREQFIKGKSALLKGQIDVAKSHFYELAAKSLQYDWDEAHQTLISHSLFLLSEISRSESEKKFWIIKALAFTLGEVPEPQSLSKNSRELIYKLKLSHGVTLKLPQNLFSDWDTVLINGKAISPSANNSSKIIPDSYRMTLISNRFRPQTLTLHSNQFEVFSPEKDFLVSGSCNTPTLNPKIDKKKKYLALLGENCSKTWANGWDSDKNLKLLPNYNLSSQPLPQIESENSSLLKSKWFWGGLILLGALVVANQSSDSSSTPQPPTTALPPAPSGDDD